MSLLRPLADDIEERRARAREGGGEERIARQHAAGRLTARERVALLVDDGTFTELGLRDPRETRPAIIGALEMAEGKRIERPWKRHAVVPV